MTTIQDRIKSKSSEGKGIKYLKPLFSSLTDNWNTPKSIYQILDAEFRFDFDPCPEKPTFDGLSIEWGGV